jgi:hypothetical protein
MRSLAGRRLELEFGQLFDSEECKNFLCSPESRIREWFPTLLEGRIRALALDPYGTMTHKNQKNGAIMYKCLIETCHVKLHLRKVQPDTDGNEFGLYGCFEHQHELMAMKNSRSEIVFKNRKDAEECFKSQNFICMYSVHCTYKQNTGKKENLDRYQCRRNALKKGLGYTPCRSYLSVGSTFHESRNDWFKNEKLDEDIKPCSIAGIFYHSHKNDERFHKTKYGAFRRLHDDPSLDKPKKNTEIRIIDGQLYPIYARKYVTIEEVLATRKPARKKERKKGKHFVCKMIDLEQRIRDSQDPLDSTSSNRPA